MRVSRTSGVLPTRSRIDSAYCIAGEDIAAGSAAAPHPPQCGRASRSRSPRLIAAALIHVWFFVMESLWFMRPAVYRRFGLESEAEATVVRSFAFNQGFYNLFLAAGVAIGLALIASGEPPGRRSCSFACGSMIAAGVVLVLHNPRFLRAAAHPGRSAAHCRARDPRCR